ncbi:hypothetical protein F3Y22_tig00110307pilonHSYRG00138 [Hibiscus syriacus]|uniref:Uncharacterized protein n=1 Tax=Hibiscus syriacus TaxID=106335 RepID=A0A6A3B2Q9_HIBSY|nr:hypothetical protein F3Y22_tig00110307pilonHSYRG00138 [Hibiscus syriacus]
MDYEGRRRWKEEGNGRRGRWKRYREPGSADVEESADDQGVFVVSFVLSIMFCFIVMKLNLTTGSSRRSSLGWLLGSFRQDLDQDAPEIGFPLNSFHQAGKHRYSDLRRRLLRHRLQRWIRELPVGELLGLFSVAASSQGKLSALSLTSHMQIDFKLTYPSGTATAHLINSFHTPQGAKLAKKQVKALGKFFSFSFLWGFFQWFFTAGDDCGFVNFPTLGLKHENKFYFDFSATYVEKGDWYPAGLPTSNMHGLQGYKVFIAIAMILGDGLYNFFKVFSRTLTGLFIKSEAIKLSPLQTSLEPLMPRRSSHGGVLAGLAACGVMMNIVSTASDLMQDFKTGYLTLASPSQYPAPFAIVYRNMGDIGGSGVLCSTEKLPIALLRVFAAAILINFIKDVWEKVNKARQTHSRRRCLGSHLRRRYMDVAEFNTCSSRS